MRAALFLASLGSVWAPLERVIDAMARRFARRMQRRVLNLIFLTAWLQICGRAAFQRDARKGGRPRAIRSGARRAVFGSRLRRLVRARCGEGLDPRARIAELIALLTHIDAHAARLAKRLRHGLARRGGGFIREARALALAYGAPAPLAISDTS